MKVWRTLIVLFFIMAGFSGNAVADVYMFIDDDGVLHFTNVPTSSNYKLYLKEKTPPAGSSVTGRGSRRFDPIIKKAARTYGLDFSLIKAVVNAESGFNTRAVSTKGAKGLMQIMPSNYEDLEISDPFDPTENIMGGTRYLKQLMTRYRGRTNLALAAYNAGPEAVDRYRTIPPFEETQNYVRKVMRLYRYYNLK